MTEIRELAMFPLGSVLFPHGLLPLHIFEQRYQQLLNHVLEHDRLFGVVLISRGWEVGGGDTRTDVGTVVRIDEHQRADDGRAAVIATGVRRLRVSEWLEDRPYPRAIVEVIDDPLEVPDLQRAIDAARARLDQLLSVAHETGRLASIPELSFSDDAVVASWQLANVAPLETLDRQRLLEIDEPVDRMGALTEQLGAKIDDLRWLADGT